MVRLLLNSAPVLTWVIGCPNQAIFSIALVPTAKGRDMPLGVVAQAVAFVSKLHFWCFWINQGQEMSRERLPFVDICCQCHTFFEVDKFTGMKCYWFLSASWIVNWRNNINSLICVRFTRMGDLCVKTNQRQAGQKYHWDGTIKLINYKFKTKMTAFFTNLEFYPRFPCTLSDSRWVVRQQYLIFLAFNLALVPSDNSYTLAGKVQVEAVANCKLY